MAGNLHSPKPPDSMIISYMTLRKIIGFMGFLLVPVLITGSFILDHTTTVQVSVSAYYYTGMRNLLVGVICGIALFLLSYHGYAWQDSLCSKLAGVFALGIALFPTSESNDKNDVSSIVHYVAAAIFFALLSYMSLFLFTKSAGFVTTQKKERNAVYRVCGIIMIVSVILIPLTNRPAIYSHIAFIKPTLLLEAAALLSFGFSWLTKGEFLLRDK